MLKESINSTRLFSFQVIEWMSITYTPHHYLIRTCPRKNRKKGSITTATADIIKYRKISISAILLGNATVTDGMNTLEQPRHILLD